jgi:hypothetical protein
MNGLAKLSRLAPFMRSTLMAKLEIVDGRFLYNLDADAGKGSPKRLDDVELVRFGYFCIKVSSKLQARIPSRMKTALESLQAQGPFLPDLQVVIDAHQADRDRTQDEKVSVGKPQLTHDFNYDGTHSWIIFSLCMSMIDRLPNQYPRIDLDKKSGLTISKKVRELLRIE